MKWFRAPLGALCLATLFLCSACVPMRQSVRGGTSEHPTASPEKVVKITSPAPFATGGAHPWENELEGLASWYGVDFNGRLTASGEVYDMYEMTAAHKTLPLQTVVRVRNLENGKKTKVRINDRGPYVEGRVIDLSRKAARALGMRDNGTARVKIEILKMP